MGGGVKGASGGVTVVAVQLKFAEAFSLATASETWLVEAASAAQTAPAANSTIMMEAILLFIVK
jgi:hypothetical protein